MLAEVRGAWGMEGTAEGSPWHLAHPSSCRFSGNSAPGFSINPHEQEDTDSYPPMHRSVLALCRCLGV